MREEWFQTFQTRANFKAIDNILSAKQLYEIFIWFDSPIHLSVLKTLIIRINIYNHPHFSSSFSSSSLSFYPSSSFMLPMPADNKAAVGSFVSITWPFAMSANWGSILFLINLSLSNNFLYSSSEINLFVSKTPYGTTNGLNYEKKLPEFLSIWLCSTIFLLDLRWIAKFKDALVSVLFDNFDLVDCHIIQKRRNNFPWNWNTWRSVNNPKFEQSTTVVQWDFLKYVFKNFCWDLTQTHSSKIVNEIPAFDLTWNEHSSFHFF